MKRYFFLALTVLFIQTQLFSQEDERPDLRPIQVYLGFQPMVSTEPYDEYRQTIDVNIAPLVVEFALDRRWSARLSPILNLQFRPEFPSALSHLGASLTIPYHLSKKNDEEGHRGFYAGPNIALTRHQVDGFNSLTGALEMGYAFLMNERFSITIGAQAGQTIMFLRDLGYNRVVRHTGAIFSLGYWF